MRFDYKKHKYLDDFFNEVLRRKLTTNKKQKRVYILETYSGRYKINIDFEKIN